MVLSICSALLCSLSRPGTRLKQTARTPRKNCQRNVSPFMAKQGTDTIFMYEKGVKNEEIVYGHSSEV